MYNTDVKSGLILSREGKYEKDKSCYPLQCIQSQKSVLVLLQYL